MSEDVNNSIEKRKRELARSFTSVNNPDVRHLELRLQKMILEMKFCLSL